MVLVTACRWMSTPRVAYLGARNPGVALVGGRALVFASQIKMMPLS
jgi:hypothetical protein